MSPVYNILYVDDEPALLEIGKLFLEQSGRFSVDTVTSALTALDRMKSKNYDAIISDYQMPEMDGIEFLKVVRSSGNTIPFILFTGRGREEIVIQALNEGANFYLQKGGAPKAQFAELIHKIQIAVEHHRATERIQSLNRLYSVLSATNKAIFQIQTKAEFFSEICRILVETGGFRMAWIGFADPEHNVIRPVAHAGQIDGYLDGINISTGDDAHGRGPVGAAYREGRHYFSNDVANDPEMVPWRENALKRGYMAIAAFPFAPGTKNAGVLSLYAPHAGFFDKEIIDLLDELSIDISFSLKTIDDQEERKSAEDALRVSEQKYRIIVEDQTELISRFFPDGTHIFVNDAYSRYFGLNRVEVIGHRFRPDIPPEDQERVRMFFASLTPEHPVGVIEHRIIMPDGSIRWHRWSDRGIFDISGTLTEYQSIGQDITERKLVEESLRQSEGRLKRAEEVGRSGSWEFRLNENAVWASDGARALYGIGEAPGTIDEVQKIPLPEYRPLLDTALRDLISGKSAYNVEFKIKRRTDGVILDIHSFAEYDSRKNVVFGVIHDITEQRRYDEALGESEALCRYILHSSPDGIVITDIGGVIRTVSPAVLKILGSAKEHEIVGLPITNFIVPDERDRAKENIALMHRGTFTGPGEYRALRIDGSTFDVEVNGEFIRNARGEPTGMVFVARDVSGRKHAEEAMAKNEAQLNAMASNIPGVVFRFYVNNDGTTGFDYISNRSSQILGIKNDTRTFFDKVTAGIESQDRERFLNSVQYAIGTKTLWEFEGRYLKPSGERIWLRAVSCPIVENGRLFFDGVIFDNTRHKRAEEALAESRRKLDTLIRNLPGMVYRCRNDPDWTMEFVSEGCVALTGYDANDLIGNAVISYGSIVLPADRTRVWDAVQHATKNKQPFEVSYRVTHRSGNVRWVWEQGRGVLNDEGDPEALEGYISDISETMEAKDALLQVNRKLHLLSSVTRHDIRNHLFLLRSSMDVLNGEIRVKDPGKWGEIAKNSAKTIDELLEFHKEYQDFGTDTPRWQDIRKVFETAGRQFLLGDIILDPGQYGIEINADPLLMKVFYNLIDNALRYGGEMTRITLSHRKEDRKLVIMIEDNGKGIREGEKIRIFERGFGQNTGLGLFLSREILSITGITITENGKHGNGARFEIVVPEGAYRFVSPAETIQQA